MSSNTTTVNAAQQPRKPDPMVERNEARTRTTSEGRRQNSRDTGGKCFRCGSNNHLPNSRQCNGKNAKCFNCGKIGHLSRMCRSHDPVSERVHVNAVENSLSDDTCTFTVFGAESRG